MRDKVDAGKAGPRPGGDGADGPALAHYRLIARIGTGGMSEVWRALDTRLDREVALKLLPEGAAGDPEWLSMFKAEAKIVASLNHPHIVTIYSIEDAGERPFLTMEFVRGRTLRETIPPEGLPLEEFFALAVPVADAVSAAHERGIIHGDLKPGNIMMSEEGGPKILDFGLARLRKPRAAPDEIGEATRTLRLESRLTGTMLYMSPEQLQGKPLDERSDIFSLGIIFYETLSGQRPFRGESFPELMAAILKDDPPPLGGLRPDLPRHLVRILGRCLEKDPRRRVQTALDVRNELESVRRELGADREAALSSIAVLRFEDLSPEQDQGYFCDGLAEEITNTLRRVENLRVAPRTSAFRFRTADMDVREIGDRLGVRTLLCGSVRKAGQRLRVSVELACAADGESLWAERFDRELRDVFAIQDEIARAVVEEMELTLSPRERRALKQVATANVQAYDYYLRGRSYFYQLRRRGMEFALQLFSRAIELDPTYALAWAGIADCHSSLYMNFDHSPAVRESADTASRKALEIDPELAEAHAARGVALSLFGRYGEAAESFETALRLNPRLFEASYFYARASFEAGDFEKSLRLYERSCEIRPDDYQSPLLMGQIYADLGRTAEAEAARRLGVRLARERLDFKPDDVRALYMGANGLVALGERTEGLAWARRALEIEPEEPMLLYNLACIYALAEEAERAVECLEKAVDLGFSHRIWLEKDSNLDSVRSLPRFQGVAARLK